MTRESGFLSNPTYLPIGEWLAIKFKEANSTEFVSFKEIKHDKIFYLGGIVNYKSYVCQRPLTTVAHLPVAFKKVEQLITHQTAAAP